MTRKVAVYVVESPGRDRDKRFVITEMPADQAERWALRAGFAIANAGQQVPDGVLDAGMAGLASMANILVWSIRSLHGLKHEAVGDLLDELMDCVKYVPPGQTDDVAVPLLAGEGGQVEEVRTRLQLKYEVFQLHVGFSLAGALSKFQNSPAETSVALPA